MARSAKLNRGVYPPASFGACLKGSTPVSPVGVSAQAVVDLAETPDVDTRRKVGVILLRQTGAGIRPCARNGEDAAPTHFGFTERKSRVVCALSSRGGDKGPKRDDER